MNFKMNLRFKRPWTVWAVTPCLFWSCFKTKITLEIVHQIGKEAVPSTVQWCFQLLQMVFSIGKTEINRNMKSLSSSQDTKGLFLSQFAIQNLSLWCSTSGKFSSGSISLGNDTKNPLWENFVMETSLFSFPLKQTCSHFQNSSEEPLPKKEFPLPVANLVLLKLSSRAPNSKACSGCIPLQWQLQTALAGDALQLLAQKGALTCQ